MASFSNSSSVKGYSGSFGNTSAITTGLSTTGNDRLVRASLQTNNIAATLQLHAGNEDESNFQGVAGGLPEFELKKICRFYSFRIT